MKTLNGYEVVDAKAREDIAALQASGGSGGSGAQVIIVDMSSIGYNMPEDQQAIFNEIFAAGTVPENYTIYCKDSGRYYLCTSWEIAQTSNYIQCPLYESSGYKYSLRIDFDSGVYRYSYRNAQSTGVKDWKWESYIANCGSYKIIKVLIQWYGGANNYSTHEVCVSDSSYLSDTSNRYYLSDSYGYCKKNSKVALYFDTMNYAIMVEDENGESTQLDNNVAEIKGFWYWG